MQTPQPAPAANRSVEAASDQARKLEILLHLSKVLGEEIHLDRMLAIMVSEVTRAMDAERSSLFLYDESKGELYTKVAEGLQTAEIRVPLGVGIVGAAGATRESINITDAYSDPRFNPSFDKKSGFVTRSILSTPILSKTNRLVGVVQVLNKCSGHAFTEEDEAFLRAICSHLAMTLERAELVESYVQAQKMQQSLRLAHDIQMGLVPKRFPAFPDKPELDIYAMLRPALDVGGDLYDFFLLDGHRLCFIVGDVSDKGVHAALFMAMTWSAFKISAMANPDDLTATFRNVNRFLCENNESQMFVTMLAGVLDLRTGRIQYTDGGHEPPFVVRASGEVEMVEKKSGIALAFLNDYPFAAGEIQLEPGDAIVLYSDGVNEAMNIQNKLFTAERIQRTLRTVRPGEPAEFMAKAVIQDVAEFVGDAPQSDDITILIVRYTAKSRA
ncbi:MAG: SpoIIE family protein phosphatase [Bryobacteraceae bacterium]|nr:SpoIIE family protein phosphatase [Bryobacteraceae bacterium]